MALPEPENLTPRQLLSHRIALRMLLPLLLLLVAIVVPLYVLYDFSQVSGDSMVPTLLNREYLLTTRGWPQPGAATSSCCTGRTEVRLRR
jgi:hypothetical protein